MNILGIDPGQTTGWVVYDTDARRVTARGRFATWNLHPDIATRLAAGCVGIIERPVAHGPTRPQVVECAYIAGRIVGALPGLVELTRLEVKQALTKATHGEVQVRNDATAWAALKLLHGGVGCDKNGGRLYKVTSHERAALAVAYAWWLLPREVTHAL